MLKLIIALTVIFFIFACNGGKSGHENNASLSRPALSSFTDLRLGQLSNSSSPVAISAALQNGESITIFAKNATDDFDAIYVAPNSQTIQVRLDPTGRPSIVQFQNTTLTYTNYTKENTVDITIQTPDTSRKAKTITLRNQPIAQGVLDYLNGDEFLKIILQIDPDADSETRALLAAVVGALRFIGCGVEQLQSELEEFIPKDFIPKLCSSDLPKEIEEILGFSNYQEILVNLVNNKPECDNPNGYDQNSACALTIWEDLVEASKLGSTGNYPKSGDDTGSSTGGSSGGNNTGSNTGKPEDPTNTPTPTSTPTATFTPTPTNTRIGGGGSPFFVDWNGGGSSAPQNCSFSIYGVDFEVREETTSGECFGNFCLDGRFNATGVSRTFKGTVHRTNGTVQPIDPFQQVLMIGDLETDATGIMDITVVGDCDILGVPVTRRNPPP